MRNKKLETRNLKLETLRWGFSTLWIIVVVAVIGLIAVVSVGKIGRGPKPTPAPVEDAQVQELTTLSSSDEVEAIEADINATNLEDLDAELGEVDSALGEL